MRVREHCRLARHPRPKAQGRTCTLIRPPGLGRCPSTSSGSHRRPPSPARGAVNLPPPGEGGRQRRPDEGRHPPRPESLQPNAQVPPCPSGRGCQSTCQCSPTLIRPGFAGPPGIVVSLATGKGSYPMALRACPHWGKVMGAPTKPSAPPAPAPPPHKSNPARSATTTARRAISLAARRISLPAGQYHPPQADITGASAPFGPADQTPPPAPPPSPPAGWAGPCTCTAPRRPHGPPPRCPDPRGGSCCTAKGGSSG